MKILQKIIDELPNDVVNRYSVNIEVLLKSFLNYEVDLPQNVYEDFKKKRKTDSMISYLKNLPEYTFLEAENSYNWAGRISHELFFLMADANNSFYIAIEIQMCSEVRDHFGYIGPFLLKFNSYEDFQELLVNVPIENCTFNIKIDGNNYLITPQIQTEYLLVKCIETSNNIDNIAAKNDQELIEEIRQYNNGISDRKILINQLIDK